MVTFPIKVLQNVIKQYQPKPTATTISLNNRDVNSCDSFWLFCITENNPRDIKEVGGFRNTPFTQSALHTPIHPNQSQKTTKCVFIN